MKQFLFYFLLLFTGFLSAQSSLHVMSFNIRYPNPGDGMSTWDLRREQVIQTLLFHEADLIGVQEAFRRQLDEMSAGMKDYTWFGVCRTDGSTQPDPDNEFSAIFFNTLKFEQLDGGTFWLSDTPDVPGSQGWDAALPRIVTWVKLLRKSDRKAFYFFNTHFDHRGENARNQSAVLLRNRIDAIAAGFPVVVTGDFNANPDSQVYGTMTSAPEAQIKLSDALTLSQTPHFGPMGSLTQGFTLPVFPNSRIDYIFVSPEITVNKHAILSTSIEGRTASDHLPVFARITF